MWEYSLKDYRKDSRTKHGLLADTCHHLPWLTNDNDIVVNVSPRQFEAPHLAVTIVNFKPDLWPGIFHRKPRLVLSNHKVQLD